MDPLQALLGLQSSAKIVGVVTDKRELKGGKENRTFAYSVKIQGMGRTFEVTTRDQRLWDAAAHGSLVVAECGFEDYQGDMKLNVTRWGDVAALGAAAAPRLVGKVG